MAQNPSLQSIRILVLTRHPWQLGGLTTLEDAILKDVALHNLVQIECPDNTAE